MASLWTTLAAVGALSMSLIVQYPPDPAVPAHPGGASGGAASQPATQPSGVAGSGAAASSTPAAGELPAGILDPGNDAVLDTALAAGNPIKVRGSVASASWARSGSIMHVNFNDASGKAIPRGKGVVAVLFKANKDAFDKAFEGDVEKALDGKTIEVSGKLTAYRGRDGAAAPTKQIVLENPSQVRIVK